MRRLLMILVAVAALGVVTIPTPGAYASTYNGTVELTCTTLNASGTGSHVLDRDNTGSGQESLRIDVFDGTGAVIFTLGFTNALGTYSAGTITETAYTTPPTANPLRYVLTSLAGNGLPEQVDVDTTGTCDTIPTVNCTLPDAPTQSSAVDPADTSTGAAAVSPGLCGVVEVTKVVTGTVLADTTFTVQLDCTAPPAETPKAETADLPPGVQPPATKTLTFPAEGGTQTVYIGKGSCTATETPPAECTVESITPATFSVVPTATTKVTVANTCAVVVQPTFTG